jgi:hypothetical protein
LPFFDRWHGLSTWDDRGKDITLHGNTEGQGNNVEKEEVGGVGRCGLARQDTCLNSGTVSNGFIGVDAL